LINNAKSGYTIYGISPELRKFAAPKEYIESIIYEETTIYDGADGHLPPAAIVCTREIEGWRHGKSI
jgi:hypothetical protein